MPSDPETIRVSNAPSEPRSRPVSQVPTTSSTHGASPTAGPSTALNVDGHSQPSSRPVSQVPTTSTAPILGPGQPSPTRAVSYDERTHLDDGHAAAAGHHRRGSTLDDSLRRTVLPPLPTNGDGILRTSPTDYQMPMPMPMPRIPELGRMNTVSSRRHESNLDWIVPSRDELLRPRNFAERLEPTLQNAEQERLKYAGKAKRSKYALNIALGMDGSSLQVLLGALTTGLAAVTTGHQTSIVVSVLGGMTTLVASYLARVRGSGEPEFSTAKVKDLDHFIRECRAFKLDHGHETGPEYDEKLNQFRDTLEELLDNSTREKKPSLSSPRMTTKEVKSPPV
ncbi:hypothetical protein V5O48_008085 [Marasmius crinis-equi]|uniref:SMODS and SLOG-associating 2TM effector domain-containing protein n=1 Tax=Marasmius crinis-equi TaxID=585013 RepID=A0ABR3FFN0_9AGAR